MQVLTHTDLLRLNFGVFCLHLIQVALFIAVPPLFLKLGGLTVVVEIPQVTGWDWNDVHQRQLHPVDRS